MRVRTELSQTFDFGLTGHETQDSFNLTKYKELAYRSPRGVRLSALVEDKWLAWVQIVDAAPWLSNWKKSRLLDSETPGATPLGARVEPGHQARIAQCLYSEAVWGYGMFGWLEPGKHGSGAGWGQALGTDSRVRSNSALRSICRLQNIKRPNETRKYVFDDCIYRGTGLMIPCEFGDLDRWLEPLWFEVCHETANC